MSNVTKALVLCAGFGTRMGELSKNCPKPMLQIGGRPLLEHTLRSLKKCGIVDIAINVHYLAEMIEDTIGDGADLGVNITYLHEKAPSGTAGPALKLKDFLSDSSEFLVLYGDIFTNQDFAKLVAFHRLHQKIASIIVHENPTSNSVIQFNDTNQVEVFLERPDEKQRAGVSGEIKYANSGLYCFSPGIFDYIPQGEIIDFPKDVFGALVEQKLLYALKLSGHRIAIDGPDRYELAKREYERHYQRNLL